MGKASKRKNAPGLQELLQRPICYFCEKDFEDRAYLVDHQRAKHYKCDRCGRRLNTIGGLSVHMSQVHKEKLEEVANALDHRRKDLIEIFGMEGFPPDLLATQQARIANEFYKREAEHRARTGNPPPGTKPGQPGFEANAKKETIEETKKRLAEFKAKKAAAKAAADGSSGANTPVNIKTEPSSDTLDQQHELVEKPFAEQPGLGPRQFIPSSMPHGLPGVSSTVAFIPKPYPSTTSGLPATSMSFGSSGSPTTSSSLPRPSGLPPVPGLPQRPSFDTANISKEDMARMHSGQQLPPMPPSMPNNGQFQPSPYGPSGSPFGAPNPPFGIANPPYAAAYPPNVPPQQWGQASSPNGMPVVPWFPPNHGALAPQPAANDIGDQVDELIQSITNGTVMQTTAPPADHAFREVKTEPQIKTEPEDEEVPRVRGVQTSMPATNFEAASVASSSKASKKEKKDRSKQMLVYSDRRVQPEEKRAGKFTPLVKKTPTVLTQAGEESQAVTGPVDGAGGNETYAE